MKWITVPAAVLLCASVLRAEATVVVHDGRSDYQIVTPASGSPATEYAAKELQAFVQQMTAVRLPVVSEQAAGDGPAFLLGPCERNAKAGLLEEAARAARRRRADPDGGQGHRAARPE